MNKGFKSGKIPIDFSDYISPIAVEIARKQEEDLEKAIYTVLEAYNITVDKDELLKALRYDRGQYEAGYKAGYEAAQSIGAQPVKCGRWHYDNARDQCFCTECGNYTYIDKFENEILSDFCPHCGVKMEN